MSNVIQLFYLSSPTCVADEYLMHLAWNVETSVDTVLQVYDSFHPKFKSMISLATNPKVWQLRMLQPLPAWVKGNVTLIGDAAHAMYPSELLQVLTLPSLTSRSVFLRF
jgi:2-polyprenyl-6-methoxyphenol hydroxylase-like FAD-dependent oxidoreductase